MTNSLQTVEREREVCMYIHHFKVHIIKVRRRWEKGLNRAGFICSVHLFYRLVVKVGNARI